MKSNPFTIGLGFVVFLAACGLFLAAPDGVPFVYGACGSPVGGSTESVTVNLFRNCTFNSGSIEGIALHSYSVSGAYTYCELTASVSLSISGSEESRCDVIWRKYCDSGVLNHCLPDSVGLAGPGDSTIYTSASCTTHGNKIIIDLDAAEDGDDHPCDCTVSGGDRKVFEAVANCGEGQG